MTARTQITVNGITRAGVAGSAGTAADVTNGNYCTNDASTWVEVTNSDTAIHNITFQPTRQVDGQSVSPVSHAIPASTTVPVKFGPFSVADYSAQLQFNGDNAGIHIACYSIGRIF